MPTEDHHIAHLNEVIAHLKMMSECVIRGYEQAMEEVGREGDYKGKDWSEAYKFLQGRVAQFKSQADRGGQ